MTTLLLAVRDTLTDSRYLFNAFCNKHNVITAVFTAGRSEVPSEAWQAFMREVHPINRRALELLDQITTKDEDLAKLTEDLRTYVVDYDRILAAWEVDDFGPDNYPRMNFPYDLEEDVQDALDDLYRNTLRDFIKAADHLGHCEYRNGFFDESARCDCGLVTLRKLSPTLRKRTPK